MKRVVHWFRRDLRVADNTALYHACREGDEVLPVYVLSTWKKHHPWTGAHRQEFLCGCLEALSKNLEALGGRLICRAGHPVTELEKLVRETGSEAIYFNRGTDPYSRRIQAELQVASQKLGIKICSYNDVTIFDPGEILTRDGRPFRVFTPYAKAWHQLEKPAPLPRITRLSTPAAISSLPTPTLDHWGLRKEGTVIQAGERAAQMRLKNFSNNLLSSYRENRDFPGGQSTSRLSQDLRFGTLSPRTVFSRCREISQELSAAGHQSSATYVNELVWREFFMQILAHFPKVLNSDFSEEFRDLVWDTNEMAFARWCEGTTGFPIVDAGMRELITTGFMHNRVRMIVAMFLTKDLHIHWRKGEQYFLQQLVDGDIAANNGGWQWSAGTGADAAPYFRIQNPWTQTKRYDSAGAYIKKWLPELRAVDSELFTRPPNEPLAKGYPLPMIDHARERDKALERFHRAQLSSRDRRPRISNQSERKRPKS
jgi:deoxyribodipyrimidine photo-lyase